MSLDLIKALLKKKETYFAIVFIINAIAVVFGYQSFTPDPQLATIVAIALNLIPAIIAIYKHPVAEAARAAAPADSADAPKG